MEVVEGTPAQWRTKLIAAGIACLVIGIAVGAALVWVAVPSRTGPRASFAFLGADVVTVADVAYLRVRGSTDGAVFVALTDPAGNVTGAEILMAETGEVRLPMAEPEVSPAAGTYSLIVRDPSSYIGTIPLTYAGANLTVEETNVTWAYDSRYGGWYVGSYRVRVRNAGDLPAFVMFAAVAVNDSLVDLSALAYLLLPLWLNASGDLPLQGNGTSLFGVLPPGTYPLDVVVSNHARVLLRYREWVSTPP